MKTIWALYQEAGDNYEPELVDLFETKELAELCMDKLLEIERGDPSRARYVGPPYNAWAHFYGMEIIPMTVRTANISGILSLTRQD